jgi:hypothetical protein
MLREAPRASWSSVNDYCRKERNDGSMNSGTLPLLALAVALSLGTAMLSLGIQFGQRRFARALEALVAKGAVRLSTRDGEALDVQRLLTQLGTQAVPVVDSKSSRRMLFALAGVATFSALVTFYWLTKA